ncbi:MAG TPA: hypothetical protein VGD37_04190 [Kofleriaceae bacterium]|jgi:hypothetical protein
MRTAIFVYNPTSINISTCENNLELCCMGAATMPLSHGENKQTLQPGIYKIVSDHDIVVTGDTALFEVVVTTQDKDNDPKLPTLRATQSFAPLDTSALKAFMAVPEARAIANP